jgi:hypothetical protein
MGRLKSYVALRTFAGINPSLPPLAVNASVPDLDCLG